MKLKEGFVTHRIDDAQIMVATGTENFSGLVRSNATAAFIVDCLKTSTSENVIVEAILEKYDVSEKVARTDVRMILSKLRSIGALDE